MTDTKPMLGTAAIETTLREFREATDNDLGLDSRPLRAAVTRCLAPSLVVPRDEIWLRRWDGAVERIKVST